MKSDRVHVVGAALLGPGTCLLGRRRSGGAHGGCWEFPGGKVELGESPESALRRELREELGLSLRVDSFLARSETDSGGRLIVLDVYLVPLLAPAVTPECRAHEELRWFTRDALLALLSKEAKIPLAEPDFPALRVLLKSWELRATRR